jgi:hypothetical protein
MREYDEQEQEAFVRYLQDCLELIEIQPGDDDEELNAAIITLLKWMGTTTGGEHGRTD